VVTSGPISKTIAVAGGNKFPFVNDPKSSEAIGLPCADPNKSFEYPYLRLQWSKLLPSQ
jgi:hypothetical protein